MSISIKKGRTRIERYIMSFICIIKQDLNKTLLNIGFLGADREGKVGYDTLS